MVRRFRRIYRVYQGLKIFFTVVVDADSLSHLTVANFE